MRSCRDSRDYKAGIVAPTGESSSSGDIPCKGIPPTTTTRPRNPRKPKPQNHPDYSEWPPEWARLPNLDGLERLSRGEQPEPDEPSPHNTATQAKCQLSLWPLPSVARDTPTPPPAAPPGGRTKPGPDTRQKVSAESQPIA